MQSKAAAKPPDAGSECRASMQDTPGGSVFFSMVVCSGRIAGQLGV
ncbi:uncharacterized protein CLUP02_08323 [Colletotrichum lupini]|uniref:Uncharacterized protein n=1 Tax=Colletotrichum lupini TaxID=145971 RepID=A0A9Q8STC5_9PEZI|nr:uncharacterized protein CLUP02_08323 [Colletotrichum lupini]UQC82833.1 hypothetical protein CLUP02_08323 [Colletotrichum lupini]